MNKSKTKSFSLNSKIVLIVLIFIVGFAILSIGIFYFMNYYTDDIRSTILTIVGISLIVVATALAALSFLKTDDNNSQYSPEAQQSLCKKNNEVINNILNDIGNLKKRYEAIQETSSKPIIDLDCEAKKELLSEIKESFQKDFSKELIEEILIKKGTILIDHVHIDQIRDKEKDTKNRLSNEIKAITKRGTLNLVIGLCTTLVAVIVLVLIFLTTDPSLKSIAVIQHYIPRIMVVVLIEVFSFFFLRLYKQSLSDIKYFQNEMTNIDLKCLALESSLITRDREAILSLIGELSKTERNFVLKKDESTVDLEKIRYENESLKNYLDSATSFLKIKEKSIK